VHLIFDLSQKGLSGTHVHAGCYISSTSVSTIIYFSPNHVPVTSPLNGGERKIHQEDKCHTTVSTTLSLWS